MDKSVERRVKLAANFIIAAGVILLIYFFFTKAIGWILPFIFAFIIAYSIEPVVSFLEKKLRMKRVLASVITIIITLSALFFLLSYLVYVLVMQIINFSQQLPQYFETFTYWITEFSDKWTILNAALPDTLSGVFENMAVTLNNNLSTIIDPLTRMTFSGAKVFATATPKVLFSLIMFIIATFFISVDKMKIGKFIITQMSARTKEQLYAVKDFMKNAFLKYIKAMIILMLITFCELFIGLNIIRVQYALLLAFIICIIDVLPILGSGTVLIPWGLISLLTGNIRIGISLLILYVVILLVRQFLEPKIVSVQIGLYPLVTIISMYIGFKIFGIIGMFYGPFFMLLVICLNSTEFIRIFKMPQSDSQEKKEPTERKEETLKKK